MACGRGLLTHPGLSPCPASATILLPTVRECPKDLLPQELYLAFLCLQLIPWKPTWLTLYFLQGSTHYHFHSEAFWTPSKNTPLPCGHLLYLSYSASTACFPPGETCVRVLVCFISSHGMLVSSGELCLSPCIHEIQRSEHCLQNNSRCSKLLSE